MPNTHPHLLVVDDDELNQDVLRRTLELESHKVLVAGDGEEAWALLQDPATPPIQAILLDRMMPRLDGMGLLQRLQGHPRLRRIPVILQTADPNPSLIAESIREGAFYHLTKPFQRDVLYTVVEAAVRERHQLEEVHQRLEAGTRAASLLSQAEFRFRTPEEGRALATLLSQTCPDPYDASLGLWELLLNAVEHGNLGLSYEEKGRLLKERRLDQEIQSRLSDPRYAHRQVEVTFQRLGPSLVFLITDEGEGFDWTRYLDLDPERAFHAHGRGIAMARHLCFTQVTYRGRGNSVEAVLLLPPSAG